MKKRNYKREASLESPARKRARAQRNKARRDMLRQLTEKYGRTRAVKMLEGKDVNHNRPLSVGGSNNLSNLSLKDPNRNQEKVAFKGKRTTRPKKGSAQRRRRRY